MEDATSREELTHSQSLLRRMQIWLSFQGLVQGIKDVLGFGVKGHTELERLQSELDVYKAQADSLAAEKIKAEHETRRMQDGHSRQIKSMQDAHIGQMNDLKAEIEATKRAAEEAEARSKSKLATEAEENKLLRDQLQKGEQAHRDRMKDIEVLSREMENQLEAAQKRSHELETLIKAKEAAQLAVINNKSNDVSELQKRVDELQHKLDSQVALLRSTLQVLKASHPKSEDGVVESIIAAIEKSLPIATPPTPEQQTDYSVLRTYGSRIEEMDAVYRRVVPDSGRPPKPNANKGAPIDDYDNEVAEYVLSSMRVALPQLPSGRRTGIAFQPPLTGSPVETVASQSPLTGPPANTVPSVPDKAPFEPAEVAILDNYSKWERKLYADSRLDKSSIRLVDILPGSPDDKIKVRFGVHLLNEVAMQYEGLSYVCGDPKPAKKIIVNEVEAPINPNLYYALWSLRQCDSVRRMWIDAICINQMSLNEKSKEVQRMGPIYSRAKTVSVFLGAPIPSKSTSISIFIKFLNRDDDGEAADRYAGKGLRALERICKKCQTDVYTVCKGFIEVCLQPWWGRIWTLVSSAFFIELSCFTLATRRACRTCLASESILIPHYGRAVFLLAFVDKVSCSVLVHSSLYFLTGYPTARILPRQRRSDHLLG
jgi:Heterokaryon incompatibility protein (HET)